MHLSFLVAAIAITIGFSSPLLGYPVLRAQQSTDVDINFGIREQYHQKPPVEAIPSLYNATLESLQHGLAAGLFSSVDLVTTYIVRIGEVNDTLHAVTELNPDAIEIARSLDEERQNGKVRGPLHGIPILVKNNIGTADKTGTTAGSYALLGARVKEDATVVRKLREAGAIILGKANMSQWSNYRSLPSSNGWAAIGGQTTGAYFPNQDPCGSSSGSGVATSIGLAWAALGTETDGSIVCPSEKNNVVGIKPTVGLTSRNGAIPISEHQDTIGPLARTVKDAAYLLQAIVGVDAADNYTSSAPFNGTYPDYVKACRKDALKGIRIGVPRNLISDDGDGTWGDPQDAILRAFNNTLKAFKRAGAEIIDPANFTDINLPLEADWQENIMAADFIVNLRSYFANLEYNPNNLTGLESLRRYTYQDPRELYPDINTAAWDTTIASGFNNTSPQFWTKYQNALEYANTKGVIGTIRREKLNAIIMPTAFAPNWAAQVGSPIISVPLGFMPKNIHEASTELGDLIEHAPGIPFGISFLGEKWSEEQLIGYAYAFEQATKTRIKGRPYLKPRTELGEVIGRTAQF